MVLGPATLGFPRGPSMDGLGKEGLGMTRRRYDDLKTCGAGAVLNHTPPAPPARTRVLIFAITRHIIGAVASEEGTFGDR